MAMRRKTQTRNRTETEIEQSEQRFPYRRYRPGASTKVQLAEPRAA